MSDLLSAATSPIGLVLIACVVILAAAFLPWLPANRKPSTPKDPYAHHRVQVRPWKAPGKEWEWQAYVEGPGVLFGYARIWDTTSFEPTKEEAVATCLAKFDKWKLDEAEKQRHYKEIDGAADKYGESYSLETAKNRSTFGKPSTGG